MLEAFEAAFLVGILGVQLFSLKGGQEKLNEEYNTCRNCVYFQSLPFSDELVCMCEESKYADCPCNPWDTCEEFRGNDDA